MVLRLLFKSKRAIGIEAGLFILILFLYILSTSRNPISHERTRTTSSPPTNTIVSTNTKIFTFHPQRHQQWRQDRSTISKTLRNIDKCMSTSNLISPALLKAAKQNAQLFMEQYGSIISPQYLDGYVNHCWNIDYHLVLDKPFMKGQIDGRNFKREIPGSYYGERMKRYFKVNYNRMFNTSTVCLPNIYLLGFAKCGSTFFWCLLSNFFNKHLNYTMSKSIQALKEPFYWTPLDYKPALPSPQKLAGEYIPNFIMASDHNISEATRKKMALIDGCARTVLDWPRFNESEPELANYCLLPSALPELFPHSKYLVIMREPVSMMYSAFWWSVDHTPPHEEKKRFKANPINGSQIFHDKASEKITQFMDCMNSHPTVINSENCTLWGRGEENYASCISNRTHLLSQCVANITTKREFLDAVIYKGIYYVHVRKWLQTLPRERIFFTTMEKLTEDTHTVMNEVIKFFGINKTIKKEKLNCTTNSNKSNYRNPSLSMKDYTKTMLTKFFQPFNKMLSNLLEDNAYLWST